MRPSAPAIAVAALALACIAAAAPSGPIFFPGRQYGLGERQSYAMSRDARLTVRFARTGGAVSTKTVSATRESSVAFTVEGFTDSGMPVLGVAIADQKSSDGSGEGASAPASPVIDGDGGVRSESFAEFAPATSLLNGLDAQALDIGATWHGQGDLALPFARMTLRLKSQVNFKSGDVGLTLLQALVAGNADVAGHPSVAPFGAIRLTGSGTAAGSAFFSPERRLLLGMELTMTSHGNATDARGRRGAYNLVAHWSIKLARYAPGILPGPGISPGIGIPVTQMGAPEPGATNVYSQGSPADVFAPASINPDVIDRSNASAPPTLAPSPDESLPPVPIEMPSDQPMASPPPGPSPTPS
jgi:hypothetical protein